MGVNTLCCCGPPPTPCGCTFPATLGFTDASLFATAFPFFFDATSITYPVTLTYGSPAGALPGEIRVLDSSGTFTTPYITLPETAWFSAALTGAVFGSPVNAYVMAWLGGCTVNVMGLYNPMFGAQVSDRAGLYGSKLLQETKKTCTPFEYGRPFSSGGAPVFTTFLTGTHGSDDVVANSTGDTLGPRNMRDGSTYTLSQRPPVGTVSDPGPTRYVLALGTTPQIDLAQTGSLGTTAQKAIWIPGPGDTVAWSSSDTSIASILPVTSIVSTRLTFHGVAGNFTLTGTVTTSHAQPSGSLTVTQDYRVG